MITITEYDPSWPEEYRRTAAELAAIAPDPWLIEHIGSTSVPGLAAKPIVDLAVRVDSLDEVEDMIPQLRTIGWYPIRGGPRTHRVLVKMRDDQRTHIAHFFPAEAWEHCHQRMFRDWLRAHPEDRDRYGAAKRAAAVDAASGRDYTLRKRSVVAEITNRARADRGLHPIDVWDK